MEDDGKKPRRKWVRIVTNKYVIVTFLFLILVLFVDRNNLLRWGRDVITISRQERTIRRYDKDIRKLEDKLQELTSDKDSLEKFAREQYYFQKEGEDVFIVD